MQFLLGFIGAIATGILAIFAVTWTGRRHGATRRHGANLARWPTCAAVRPQCAHGLCPEPPGVTSSQAQLSTDGERFWMISHDLAATDTSASGPTHRADGVWKVMTFVRHIPRLSAEERQYLLTAWDDRHHGGSW